MHNGPFCYEMSEQEMGAIHNPTGLLLGNMIVSCPSLACNIYHTFRNTVLQVEPIHYRSCFVRQKSTEHPPNKAYTNPIQQLLLSEGHTAHATLKELLRNVKTKILHERFNRQ